METIFILTLVISLMLLGFMALKVAEAIFNKPLDKVIERIENNARY